MTLPVSRLKELALILQDDAALHRVYPRDESATVAGRRNRIVDALRRETGSDTSGTDREHLRRYLDNLWESKPARDDYPGGNSYFDLAFIDLGIEDPPVKPKQIDYTELPDGTILVTRLQGEWIKGVQTDSGIGKPRTGFPLWASSTDRDRSWMCWRADGMPERPADNDYDVVGYRLVVTNPSTLTNPTNPTIGDAEKEIAPMNKPAIIEITSLTLVNGNDVSELSDNEIYGLIAAQEVEIVRLEAIKAKPKKLQAELAKRRAGIDALVAHLDAKE